MGLFDDARRYVDLAKGGWVNDTINPIELIEQLCDAHESEMSESVDSAVYDKEGELQDEINELRKKSDYESMKYPELMAVMGEIMGCLESRHNKEVEMAFSDGEVRGRKYGNPPTPAQVEDAHEKKRRGRPRKT